MVFYLLILAHVSGRGLSILQVLILSLEQIKHPSEPLHGWMVQGSLDQVVNFILVLLCLVTVYFEFLVPSEIAPEAVNHDLGENIL